MVEQSPDFVYIWVAYDIGPPADHPGWFEAVLLNGIGWRPDGESALLSERSVDMVEVVIFRAFTLSYNIEYAITSSVLLWPCCSSAERPAATAARAQAGSSSISRAIIPDGTLGTPP